MPVGKLLKAGVGVGPTRVLQVAPLPPQPVQRARWRIMSLDASQTFGRRCLHDEGRTDVFRKSMVAENGGGAGISQRATTARQHRRCPRAAY